MAQTTFVDRLKPVVGKPAATMVYESGKDRHAIIELTFAAVVGYLGGKFLDGFVEGLGIPSLGKSVGEAIKAALGKLGDLINGGEGGQTQEQELQRQTVALQKIAGELAAYASNDAARAKAEKAVKDVLAEKGLPAVEADRIAKAVGAEMLKTDA
jgi:hypothetical protein